jgi:tetratricopeptide (TPR) repeat protein
VGCLSELGRNAEAMQVGEDALAITDRVLAQRPGHRMALHAAQVITSGLCAVASNQLDPAQELRIGKRDQQVSQTLLALDPHNVASLNNLGVADQAMGDALWASGKFPDAIAAYHQAVEDFALATPGGSGFGIIHAANRLTLAISQARLGDASAAEATLAGEQPFLDKLRASEPPGGSFPTLLIENIMRIGAAAAAYFSGDVDRARQVAADSVQKIHAAKTEGAFQSSQVGITAYYGLHLMARVDYLHADYPAAEREERQAMADRKHWSTEGTTDQRDLAEVSTWLAMSLAKQGKLADASREIAPVVKLQRELAARNHGDIWLPTELAAALYAQALAEPSHRAPLLKEAAALLDGVAAPLKPLREIRQWRERIHQAQVQL